MPISGVTMSFTNTNMAVQVGAGPASFNLARGAYAIGIRLSISPTVYADAAVYFKIFDSTGPPGSRSSTCDLT